MKRKFILGILIALAMTICGVFCNQTAPVVFADETIAQESEININDAGTFQGYGYYEADETAKLTASMNPGYQFKAWVGVDEQGNETELSTDLEYTFVVAKNMTIKPTFERLQYTVSFADDLEDNGAGQLKDFTYTISNKTQNNGKNYYNNQIEIQLTTKSGTYIEDLNVAIKTENTNSSIDDMNFDVNETKNNLTGVSNLVITFDIQDNVTISMVYKYKYVLTLQASEGGVPIDEVMNFITLRNVQELDANAHTYIAPAGQSVSIDLISKDPNGVYYLEGSQFSGYPATEEPSKTYVLSTHSTISVKYLKNEYIVDFNSYVINLYGQKDLMQNDIYNIANVALTAGDSVGFSYDQTTRQVTIIDASNTEIKYSYPTSIFGYRFVGFAIGDEMQNANTYTLSTAKPANVEIRLIFEYIEYNLEIRLIDEYFASDASYGIVYDNEFNKLIAGTQVTLQASTNEYIINGWSATNNPRESGYLDIADENAKNDSYSYTFEPVSDDNSQPYIVYLDVDYSYLSVEYNLKPSSIVKNVDYDVVNFDATSKTIIFSDSENKVTSKTINYTDEDVAVEQGKTIISTLEFGDIEIEEDKMTYTTNLIKHTSINKTSQSGIDTYTFKKYTYFGDLQVGIIDNISLTEQGEEVTVNFNGTIYPEQNGFTSTILTFTTTKVYNDKEGAYALNYYKTVNEKQTSLILTAYLYMNGTEYDSIVFRKVIYYYDTQTNKFVPRKATINTPKDIDSVIVKNETYSIKLNNLLSSSILVYSTRSTNEVNYSFINYTNKVGTSLGNFENDGNKVCILNSTTTDQLNVEYRQLSNNITLLINIENAYQYENVSIVVDSADGIISSTGNAVSARDDEIITITIAQASIARGYKFDNYTFNGSNITNAENPMVLVIPMDASVYANQIININFSAIEYTINVNYINDNGEIVEQDDNIGYLCLQGQSKASTIVVDITNEYILQSVSIVGYYVGNAYIGTEAYILEGLLGSNSSQELITTWTLNSTNFEQAIIDNAGEGTAVNLYINFVAHTYSAKVYFEISSKPGAIIYPTLKINGVAETLTSTTEEVDGISVTKRFVEASGFAHNSNVVFELADFMMGTTMERWCDAQGTTIAEHATSYTKKSITGDIVLKVVLQYLTYSIEFVSVDESGQPYGEGQACGEGLPLNGIKTFKLFDIVRYDVNVYQGYVLKQKYYYDSTGEVDTNDIESGFVFNPANFKIEDSTKFKIYLEFGLKTVNLKISNEFSGEMYYFDGQSASDLALYSVSRKRGETIEELDDLTGYEFLTGDKLIMQIIPISIGIQLNSVNIGPIVVNLGDNTVPQYLLKEVEIKDEGKLIGIAYELTFVFTPDIISRLSSEDDVAVQNMLQVKSFDVKYTYNYIDYAFGIRLTRRYEGGSSATGNTDTAMEIKSLGFGTGITFGCTWEGMNTGDGSKFIIEGYSIDGFKKDANASNDRYAFDSVELWEDVALNRYVHNNRAFEIVLLLKPKITLHNYTSYSDEEGYIYNSAVYNGQTQGLIPGVDVVVGGDFEISIKYSSVKFEGDYPIDAGTYNVEINAKISDDIPAILFEETVTYSIAKAPVNLVLKTFSSNKPLTKVYGEKDELYLQTLKKDIIPQGVYSRDTIVIEIGEIKFPIQKVNTMDNLYDIIVNRIVLKTNQNQQSTNYELSNGSTQTFPGVGKINPKPLEISGFKINNKVYDGTPDVYVDATTIVCDEPIAGDTVDILYDNLKFYLKEYNIGKSREVFVDWSNVLTNADSGNYEITYAKTYIDVHPYEISCDLSGYGTFKVVDVDKKALIPIGSRMIVKAFEKGSAEYRTIYSLIESDMKQGEKLKNCFEVILQVNSVNLQISDGLYVYIPKTNKTTKVVQVYQDDACESLKFGNQGDYTIVKVVKGEALLGVVADTTYLPLWAIILIVIGALLLVGTFVVIFIIVRRKTKNKYSKYDRI